MSPKAKTVRSQSLTSRYSTADHDRGDYATRAQAGSIGGNGDGSGIGGSIGGTGFGPFGGVTLQN